MDTDQPFDLANDSAVFLTTVSGQVIFVLGKKRDLVTDRAVQMARIAEGIEVDPGQGAPLSAFGVAQRSIQAHQLWSRRTSDELLGKFQLVGAKTCFMGWILQQGRQPATLKTLT